MEQLIDRIVVRRLRFKMFVPHRKPTAHHQLSSQHSSLFKCWIICIYILMLDNLIHIENMIRGKL